jgi:hypothetical protein
VGHLELREDLEWQDQHPTRQLIPELNQSLDLSWTHGLSRRHHQSP